MMGFASVRWQISLFWRTRLIVTVETYVKGYMSIRTHDDSTARFQADQCHIGAQREEID